MQHVSICHILGIYKYVKRGLILWEHVRTEVRMTTQMNKAK
jgi:hypothetical protein